MLLKDFAQKYDTLSIIKRALLYHPNIELSLYCIPVDFNMKLDAAAGNFRSNPLKINLHVRLPQHGLVELQKTFLHETAHAMQWLAYKEVNHGESWWEMMHHLAQKPERCHSMDLKARTKLQATAKDLGL